MEFLGSNEEGMGVGGLYRGGTLSPEGVGGATPAAEDRIVNFFLQKRPVASCLGDRGPVALPMGDRGPFLKFLGTAIYF